MRQREPCCWKCTSSVAQRSTAASSINPWSFFYAPSAVQDRLAQSRDEACVAENPTAETDAGIAVRPSRSCTPAQSRSPASCRPTDFRSSLALAARSEEHTSELQSQFHLVCRLLLEKKKIK